MSGTIRQLANLIRKDRGASLAYGMAFNIASELIAEGALIPPVKSGQTVYSVLIYDPEDELNEDFIEEYTVNGVAYIEGEWYVFDKRDREMYKVGSDYCKLTREEAEAAIKEARNEAL